MMLGSLLNEAGYIPKRLDVKAEVRLNAETRSISESHLQLRANIPNINTTILGNLVKQAAETCPISRSINAKITHEYDLWVD